MARRRRRSKFTWFPVLFSGDEAGQDVNGTDFSINVPLNGQVVTQVFAVTFDAPKDSREAVLASPGELAGILGQEYLLKRIVGKVFLQNSGSAEVTDDVLNSAASLLIGCGFFVARADEDPNDTVPIGANTAATLFNKYSPLAVDTVREPWIWRRTWILGLPETTRIALANNTGQVAFTGNPVGSGGGTFRASHQWPGTNAGYGSIQDGPHIDAKTGRRVRQDDRLWFSIAATSWPLATTVSGVGVANRLDGHLDIRLLGALRRARQGSSF